MIRLVCRLISEVRVTSSERAGDPMDLVAATVDPSHRIVEHAIFGEDLVNRSAPTRRVVLTEDVVKIAGQQGRYAERHGCWFSSLQRVPALIYRGVDGRRTSRARDTGHLSKPIIGEILGLPFFDRLQNETGDEFRLVAIGVIG